MHVNSSVLCQGDGLMCRCPKLSLGECYYVSSTVGEADRVQQVPPVLQLWKGSLDHRMQVCLASPTQLGASTGGKSRDLCYISWLSPGLNQHLKLCPVSWEWEALTSLIQAASRLSHVSQRVAIYGFGQNNRIAKLRLPDFFFSFSSTLSFLFLWQ